MTITNSCIMIIDDNSSDLDLIKRAFEVNHKAGKIICMNHSKEALAYLMGVGLVVMRRPGNLPGEVFTLQQEQEFGDTREVIKDSIKPGQRVLIVDELLATGGTSATSAKIIEKLGAIVVGTAFLIEITGLGGRAKLKDYDTISLIQYNY